MTALALTLVLVAAVLHATWNLLAKRAGGGLPFVWLVCVVISCLYVPVIAGWVYVHGWGVTTAGLAWILGSGVIKTGYSLFLQRSYRSGDFSLTYPVARGTGPLLAMLGAVLLFGERPSLLAVAGALLILGGVFHVAGGPGLLHQDRAHLRIALGYGVTTGLFIAAYTLWDRHGVAELGVAPVLFDAGTCLVQVALLTPFAVRRWPEVARHWREHRGCVVGMAILSPIAYVLVLTAMRFTPVSYVAPAREVSIIIGAYLGAKILKEGENSRRLPAAVAMTAGVIALALG